MQNPYIALLRTAWTYARHEKRQYVLVYFLFTLGGQRQRLALARGILAAHTSLRQHSAVFRDLWAHQPDALRPTDQEV